MASKKSQWSGVLATKDLQPTADGVTMSRRG